MDLKKQFLGINIDLKQQQNSKTTIWISRLLALSFKSGSNNPTRDYSW